MNPATITNNGTTYTSTKFNIGKTIWTVTIVKGKYNYITVKKPSPWMALGKEFKTMDLAISHYKNPTMKTKLLQLEMGLTLND